MGQGYSYCSFTDCDDFKENPEKGIKFGNYQNTLRPYQMRSPKKLDRYN